jgi:hypothetical protein
VRCIDPTRRARRGPTAALALAATLLGGCAQRGAPPMSPPMPVASRPAPAPAPAPTWPVPGIAPAPAQPPLDPPVTARDWDEFQQLAARRLVAANPGRIYLGDVPEPLLAIPVLEVELEADGSVRHITVLRQPTQALDTVKLAIDAVRRAAPYGDVSRLPRPWRFSEVFLFDDERRFKPRTLDQ